MDAWVNEHDTDASDHREMKKMERDIEMRMPDFDQEDMPSVPDTVIVNGDTVVINTRIEKRFRDNPDFGDNDIERYFDMPDESFDAPPCPRMEEMPGCCPFMGRPHMQDRFPFGEFNIPGLENLIPFGELDRIVVKKKRHGKEIIISLRNNENERDSRHHHGDRIYYHNDRDTQMRPQQQKRIIMREENGKEIEKDKNTKVERYKDGNKEIIIIKKNKEEDNKSE